MAARKNKAQKVKKENNEKQWLFFYTLLQASEKESDISHTPLTGNLTSMWFHHIFPKSKFPELRFCPENIMFVTADEHYQIEQGVEFKELETRKAYIAENYDELVKDTQLYMEEFLNPVYEHAKKNTVFFTHRNSQTSKKKL